MSKKQKIISGIIALLAAILATYLKAKNKILLAFLALAVGIGLVAAINYYGTFAAQLDKPPTSVAASDSGFLDATITATATTITISPIEKWVNGVKTEGCFDTGSGVVLIRDGAGRSEHVSFGTKTCSATYITTLSDIRRGLNPTSSSGSFAAGVGIQFAAGSSIRVVDWPGFYNSAMYKTNRNLLTQSGKIMSTAITSHAILRLNSATTAQRDAFRDPGNGEMFYNTSLGVFQGYEDGAWVSMIGSGTIRGSEVAAGKFEGASRDEQYNSTQSGGTNAMLVPLLKYMIRTSSGFSALTSGSVVVTDYNGALHPSLLGRGTPKGWTFLNGDRNWGIPPGTGSSLVGSQTSVAGGDTIGNVAAQTAFATTVTIASGSMKVGDVYRIIAAGYYSNGTSITVRSSYVTGSTTVATGATVVATSLTDSQVNSPWTLVVYLTVQSVGTAGTFVATGYMDLDQDALGTTNPYRISLVTDNTAAPDPVTFDTATPFVGTLRFAWAPAHASNSITMNQHFIERVSRSR